MLLKVSLALLCVGVITAYDLNLGSVLERRNVGGPNMACFQQPLDIAFVLDASASIWAQNFTKGKAFVNSFISPYEIGSDKVRVALETYADIVYTQDVIHFNDFLNRDSLQERISSLKWHHGSRTETGEGIAYMRDHIMPKARSQNVPKICIVITDGKSQNSEKTAAEAKKARENGIQMFAIGVSRAVNATELESIAGDPDRVIIVETYSELEAIKDKLSGKTCTEIPTTQPPPTTTTTQPPPPPTTTTTTTTTTTAKPPREEECGNGTPTDIYYVFDPAYLGIERTSWVTQFISHTLGVQEFLHMRFGVISGSCPLDAGFDLNQYSTLSAIKKRLHFYDKQQLPKLVGSLTTAYSVDEGGRPGARKVAVVFIGGEKIDHMAVIRNAQAARETGVDVYFADAGNADPRLLAALEEVGFRVTGVGAGARRQANAFIEALCKVPATPPPAAEECGIDNPTDIYYVFEPAYLGISRTAWVTQFITHTISVQEFLHMRFGIITGSCPLGSGSHLSQYSTISAFRQRLAFYDNPKLTTLIGSLTSAYAVDKGGRPGARKVAVVFIGGEKIDGMAVLRSAHAAREAGVDVYFANAGNADPRLLAALEDVGFSLAGAGAGARRQANAFIEALCSKRYRN